MRALVGRILLGGVGYFLLAWVLMVVVLIIYRHPHRVDFTRERLHTLSPETLDRLERLGRLPEEVRVIYPTFFQRQNPLHGIQAQVLRRARFLLTEYMVAQPRLRMEAEINLDSPTDSERWVALCEKYKLLPTQVNRFIFILGDGELRYSITPDNLALYDRPKGPHDPTPPQILEFRGQAAFTGQASGSQCGIENQGRRGFTIQPLVNSSCDHYFH